MADTKISNEAAAIALTGTEILPGVQSGGNVKITADQIKTFVGGGLSLKWTGNVAMSSNTLATLTGASGSGSGGAIKKADMFYNTAASTSLTAPDGASLIPAGCWIIALQDTPTTIDHFSFINSIL
jgi:hypothetical protein